MHEPRPKRKISSEINIYREACRNLVASHPRLHPNHKVVLMRLTDYVNRRTWDAYVSEQTLATDCGVTTRTVRRAMNAGRRFNIIKRTRRGSTWSGPNHHVFLVSAQDTRVPCTDKVHRTPVAVHRTPEVSAQDTRVLLTSEEHLNNLTAPPSSSLDNSDVVVSDNHQEEDSEKRLGEKTEVSPTTSGTPITERAEMPKQADAELQIEMAARGMDMAQSKLRRRRAVEVYSAPPVPDERPITIGPALIDQIKKKGAAA